VPRPSSGADALEVSVSPQRRFALLVASVIAILAATPALAQRDTSIVAAPPHHAIAFSPDRGERCDYFFVTEFNVGVSGTRAMTQDAVDRYLFTDALGLMRNLDRTRAVGASIDAHLTGGAIRFTPTIRFKQWLSNRISIDLTLGYANTPVEQEGVVGPIVAVRYSPTAWFHLQAGGFRNRNVRSIQYFPDYSVDSDTQLQLYAGAGLGGLPGLISWGVQAIGIASLAAALSGMD
jgi:hypothetical protein